MSEGKYGRLPKPKDRRTIKGVDVDIGDVSLEPDHDVDVKMGELALTPDYDPADKAAAEVAANARRHDIRKRDEYEEEDDTYHPHHAWARLMKGAAK